MNLRRAKDDQLDNDDARVFPDFANPELLRSENDFRLQMETFSEGLSGDVLCRTFTASTTDN